mmetsp:Transcript_25786/g.64769  ORF Transcript_25786/g.64769 Transcript_25786/m.64769 type:complete len:233 (+) Transcript_25786:335-1033(+)
MHQTLVAAVVRVDKALTPVLGQGGGVDGESVVLRGDEAATAEGVHTGLVLATVTEGHLVGGGAGSARQQLVAHADAHDRSTELGVRIHEGTQVASGLLGHAGVTGTVADKDAVAVALREQIVVVGYHLDLGALLHQQTHDVLLHTTVQQDDAHVAALVVDTRLGAAHLGDQVAAVRILLQHRILLVAVGHQLGQHAARVAQLLGEGAGVHTRDAGHALGGHPLMQGLLVAEV